MRRAGFPGGGGGNRSGLVGVGRGTGLRVVSFDAPAESGAFDLRSGGGVSILV